jgi:hypothetical protein
VTVVFAVTAVDSFVTDSWSLLCSTAGVAVGAGVFVGSGVKPVGSSAEGGDVGSPTTGSVAVEEVLVESDVPVPPAGAAVGATSWWALMSEPVSSGLPVLPYVDVCAPPELLTSIFGTPSPLVDGVAVEEPEAAGAGSVLADPVAVVAEVPVTGEAPIEPEAAPLDDVAPPLDPPDDEGAEASGSWSTSAHATPGVVATAIPTPSETASAPTRPTYLA